MSEDILGPVADVQDPQTAGDLLRQMREARGLDLDVLAAALKVPARKLELLEANRFTELPGMVFVRSMALSVCRYLHTDARPVLELLPSSQSIDSVMLETVSRGLDEPFKEPITRTDPNSRIPEWLQPKVIAPALLLLAALGFWLAPGSGSSGGASTPDSDLGASMPSVSVPAPGVTASRTAAASDSSSPVTSGTTTVELTPPAALPAVSPQTASAPTAAASVASPIIETVFSVPSPSEAVRASTPPANVKGVAVLRTSAASWIEARDADGRTLVARMMMPGEAVGLDGTLPLRLKIGNVNGTQLSLRGQAIDLTPFSRENVARVELK
jgi:cytoskeleton protein RodZ